MDEERGVSDGFCVELQQRIRAGFKQVEVSDGQNIWKDVTTMTASGIVDIGGLTLWCDASGSSRTNVHKKENITGFKGVYHGFDVTQAYANQHPASFGVVGAFPIIGTFCDTLPKGIEVCATYMLDDATLYAESCAPNAGARVGLVLPMDHSSIGRAVNEKIDQQVLDIVTTAGAFPDNATLNTQLQNTEHSLIRRTAYAALLLHNAETAWNAAFADAALQEDVKAARLVYNDYFSKLRDALFVPLGQTYDIIEPGQPGLLLLTIH